ncbi:MAG: VWA domain-containing protein [Bacillota bacterium]|nr:VWA domain-containing protein [Bacillota bacterium]
MKKITQRKMKTPIRIGKRVIALLVIAVLMAGCLSGCGKSMSDTTKAPSSEEKDTGNYETADMAAADEAYIADEEAAEGSYMTEEYPAEGEDTWYFDENGDTKGNDGGEENSAQEGSYAQSCYDYPFTSDNTEEYSKWQEKGFSSVLAEPLSTFSADVDTASYSNFRRLINDGYSLDTLPEGSVRIEEMLNYFSYDYQGPENGEPFGVNAWIGECPWNDEASLLMLGLATEKMDYEQAPPSNLVFLLDVSGSMGDDDKLPLLQEAFGLLTENLTENDRVSIVTYAGSSEVVLRGVSGDKTRKIKSALNSLEASGGTHGSAGIETAYEIAEENFIKGGNNRIILATDGDLNIGLTTEQELEDLITEKKESGIFLSVLGFGTGNIKDNKMETLADKGNGNYAYIDSMREAKKVLEEEMTATLLTICKDVKLQVEFNPAVVSNYRLIGYENRLLNREDFNDDTKDAGEIGAGHSVTVLYEIILKEPLTGMAEDEIEDLKYSKNYKEELKDAGGSGRAYEEEWLTLSIRYKKPAEDESSLLQYPVSYENYTEHPGDDFVFAAAVAELGLLASDSSYAGDASLKHVRSALKSIDLDDEYKEEFYEIVKMLD